MSKYYRPLNERLVETIKEGIASGEFRSLDAWQAGFTIISILAFYFSAAPVLSRILGHDARCAARKWKSAAKQCRNLLNTG